MSTHLEPLLQLLQVTATRPGEGSMPQTVLRDVSVTVNAGEVAVVVGPSGGGKSSLLRLCNRLLEPESGVVYFAGRDVREIDPPRLRSQAGS